MQSFILPFVFVSLFAAAPARGEAMDPQILKALEETQRVIRNPEERHEVTAKSPAAQQAEKRVQMLGGSPADQQAIFDLAAQVMGDLAKQTGGDPDKMQAILDQAMKNPEAFANGLTPEAKQRLHELSLRLPAAQAPAVH